MRKSFFHSIILVIIICLSPLSGFAETGYVSDMLVLTFRQGPGNSYPLIKTLVSDTPVSILEEESEYYKVELQSGEIGWVDKKFIMFGLPKTIIIENLKNENKILQDKIAALETTEGTLNTEIQDQKSEDSMDISSPEASLETALQEKAKLENLLSESEKKYDTLIEQSKNIQKILNENKLLQKKNTALSSDLEMYMGKDKTLFKTGMVKWFLSGVGVLLMGWIIGKSVSSKKQRSASLLG